MLNRIRAHSLLETHFFRLTARHTRQASTSLPSNRRDLGGGVRICMPMRILSDEHVQQCISVREAIEVNEQAFIALHEGRANVPPRIGIPLPPQSGITLFKPAFIASAKTEDLVNENAVSRGSKWSSPTETFPATTDSGSQYRGSGLGLKVVSVRPANTDRGLPTVPATIMTFDEHTGMATAVMNATYLTGLRTAAGSAAATRAVFRYRAAAAESLGTPHASPQSLCVLGAGLQAELHIRAIFAVCPGPFFIRFLGQTGQIQKLRDCLLSRRCSSMLFLLWVTSLNIGYAQLLSASTLLIDLNLVSTRLLLL